jgi:proteic killer suppression protein
MIKSFQHKGIEKFFKTGSKAGIQPGHAEKLRDRLFVLNNASKPSDMALPGWDFHPLSHDLKGHYAVKIDRMWRLTFAFEETNAILVDYQDYH